MPPIYTMLYNPSTTYAEFAERDVRVAPINKLAPLRRHHRVGLPIFPLVARSVFVDADVVLTSSSGWAHGFRTNGRKLVYCYSPARWLYLPDMYLGERPGVIKRLGLRLTVPYLKAWDRRAARSCDKYLANSTLIRDRIAETYGIEADVVFTPVAMSRSNDLKPVPEMEGWDSVDGAFYLCVSRLLSYKNVDAVVRAFAGSDRRLVIVGKGPEAKRLRDLKTPNVLMLSDLTDAQMAWLYKHCRAAARRELRGLRPDADRSRCVGPAHCGLTLRRIPRHRRRRDHRYVLRRTGAARHRRRAGPLRIDHVRSRQDPQSRGAVQRGTLCRKALCCGRRADG